MSPFLPAIVTLVFTFSHVTCAQRQNYYGGGPLSLNLTTLQYDVYGDVDIATDFDYVSIDFDSWGIPWDSFIYEQPLPFSWENKLNNTIASWKNWNRPVVLLVSFGTSDSKRSCPALNASDSQGGYPNLQPVGNCQTCFDWNITTNPVAAFFRQGFTNYILALTLAFITNQPTEGTSVIGVGFANDANRVLEANCGALWFNGYVDALNQVSTTFKNYYPTTPIFPVFSLESMYGIVQGQSCSGQGGSIMNTAKPSPALLNCFDQGYDAMVNIKRDIFAFTAYPTQFTSNSFQSWYISAGLDRTDPPFDTTNRWLVGTNIIADNIVVNAVNSTATGKQPQPKCTQVMSSSDTIENAWLENVINTATDYKITLITLTQARDILFSEAMTSCPCSAPLPDFQPYCNYLNDVRVLCFQNGLPSYICELVSKLQGTTGIRDLVNDVKEPSYSTLQAARETPVKPFWWKTIYNE
jgi:hypothetical protein